MRIIAGELGGRRLQTPKGENTRPTTDRVREALFSILGDHVQEAAVLDCFAGSGALGLEAWSRGAKSVVFVEPDRHAAACVQANIDALFKGEASPAPTLLKLTAERALPKLAKQGLRFDLVFMDPPYDANLYTPTLLALTALHLLNPGAIVVCEHGRKAGVICAPSPLALLDTRGYGDTHLTLFKEGSEPCA